MNGDICKFASDFGMMKESMNEHTNESFCSIIIST